MAHAVATDGERFFVGGEDVSPIPSAGKHLLALDVETGDVCWRCPTEAHSLSAAAVHEGVVYFTATDDVLRAVDAATGEERWRAEHVGWGPAPPVVAQNIVCAGGRNDTLYAYETDQGRQCWQFTAKNWFAHPLCVEGARLCALGWDGHLYVLDIQKGELLWEGVGERRRGFTTPPAAGSRIVYLGSRVYHTDGEGQHPGYALVALDVDHGEERWRHYTEKHIFTPPLVAQGQVYFGSNNGILHAVDADTGDAAWHRSVTSRAVTQPRLAGDLVIFGGRDGMVHAVQWRAVEEETLDPDTHLKQGEFVEAAAAYALQGQLAQAAELYEYRIGGWQKAVQLYQAASRLEPAAKLLEKHEKRRAAAELYEEAKQDEQAATLWEGLGELRRARDLYEKSGDRKAYARVLEKMGEYLDAAHVLQDLEIYEDAARLFQMGGERLLAADIYYKRLNDKNKALEIWRALDEWEKEVRFYLRLDKKSKAAQVLMAHQELDRAADLFEEIGELGEALELRRELENWEKVALLAEQLGKYEEAADAWAQLDEKIHAAEACVEAAKREKAQSEPDETRLAELYEKAANLYTDIFEDEKAGACRRMVKRYRRLPHLAVQVRATAEFIEYQYNELHLTLHNRGFGIAKEINVQFEGEFDVSGDCCLRGLIPDRPKELIMSVRPHRDQYGSSVPLKIIVTYLDMSGDAYRFEDTTRIAVEPERSLEKLFGGTPHSITIGEFYQQGARKISGDSFEGRSIKAGGDVLNGEAQKGDRVEMHRETSMGRDAAQSHVTASEKEQSPKVTRRDAGPVRRCPICNVPTSDPEQRYCADCGAPLPSPNVKEDI